MSNTGQVGSQTSHVDGIFLAALLALAIGTVAAAIYYRFGFSLTLDEPFMANAARLPWDQLWRQIFPIDNLPLGYLALKLWTAAFGESELALRSLSSIAYGGAVVFTGLAARRGGGNAAGLVAAALVAASDRMGLEYAATVRTYALASLISAAAVWQTIRILQIGDADPRLAGAALFVTHLIGAFTHPAYLLIALAFACASALIERHIWSVSVIAPIAAALSYMLVWAPVVRQTVALQTTFWMRTISFDDIRRACALLWGVGPGFMLAGALMVALLKAPRPGAKLRDSSARWFIAAALCAWLLPIVVSLWRPVFQWDRTPVMLLPVTCAAISIVLTRCAGTAGAIAFAIVCVGAAAHRIVRRPRTDPSPSRATLSSVLGQTSCGDTVIAAGLASTTVGYYFRRLHAPPCVRLLAFPADVRDLFANWSGRLRNPASRGKLELEAARTAQSAAGSQHVIWLIGVTTWETREATGMMQLALASVADCGPPEPAKGAFIDTVRRCVSRR